MTNTPTGFTVWLTGMNGAGKSTLAKYLAQRFQALGRTAEVLESNEVHELFAKGLGETKDDRNLLVKRLGFAARGISNAAGVAIVPALSPYRDARDQLRRDIGRFVEVFVDCPVDVLLARDTTGRYKKAMSGEIPNFVGITDPYEPPQNPEVVIRSDTEPPTDAAERIFQSLLDLGYLRNDEVQLLAGKSLRRGKPSKKPAERSGKPGVIKVGTKAAAAAKASAKPASKSAKPAAKSAKPAPKVAAKDAKPAPKASKPAAVKPAARRPVKVVKSRPAARAAKTVTAKKKAK